MNPYGTDYFDEGILIYARVEHPENGYDCDRKELEKLDYKKVYRVTYILMGGSHTLIYLNNVDGVFNSVNFEFYENGSKIDIYSDPRFNPYMKRLV